MISLSLEEKDFLKSIVNLSKRTRNMFFGNLVDKYLSNIDVHITDKKDVEYRFDEQYFIETKSLHEVTLKISWTFLRFIKLLKYLEENNYLNFYLEIEDPNFSSRDFQNSSPKSDRKCSYCDILQKSEDRHV